MVIVGARLLIVTVLLITGDAAPDESPACALKVRVPGAFLLVALLSE